MLFDIWFASSMVTRFEKKNLAVQEVSSALVSKVNPDLEVNPELEVNPALDLKLYPK